MRSGVGKALVAIGVFALVVGGWFGWVYYRAMTEPLPGGDGRQGRCVLWFVGSSSIAKWATLDADMRPWIAHNRGVGGAQLSQIVRRFGNGPDLPAPEAIVFYAGENDIAAGVSVDQAFSNFRALLTLKDERFGRTPVFFVSLKPTPARWSMRPQQADYNTRARRLAAARSDLTYVDIVPDMLVGGRPGPFFDESGIHMHAIGYSRWARRVRAALDRTLPEAAVRCGGQAGSGAGA